MNFFRWPRVSVFPWIIACAFITSASQAVGPAKPSGHTEKIADLFETAKILDGRDLKNPASRLLKILFFGEVRTILHTLDSFDVNRATPDDLLANNEILEALRDDRITKYIPVNSEKNDELSIAEIHSICSNYISRTQAHLDNVQGKPDIDPIIHSEINAKLSEIAQRLGYSSGRVDSASLPGVQPYRTLFFVMPDKRGFHVPDMPSRKIEADALGLANDTGWEQILRHPKVDRKNITLELGLEEDALNSTIIRILHAAQLRLREIAAELNLPLTNSDYDTNDIVMAIDQAHFKAEARKLGVSNNASTDEILLTYASSMRQNKATSLGLHEDASWAEILQAHLSKKDEKWRDEKRRLFGLPPDASLERILVSWRLAIEERASSFFLWIEFTKFVADNIPQKKWPLIADLLHISRSEIDSSKIRIFWEALARQNLENNTTNPTLDSLTSLLWNSLPAAARITVRSMLKLPLNASPELVFKAWERLGTIASRPLEVGSPRSIVEELLGKNYDLNVAIMKVIAREVSLRYSDSADPAREPWAPILVAIAKKSLEVMLGLRVR